MGYMHIDNLYKNTTVLNYTEVYALEKVHGTSAHLRFTHAGDVVYSSGGADPVQFKALFDEAALTKTMRILNLEGYTVYGEAYGGKVHRGKHQYGYQLRFVVFDVKGPDDNWLDVLQAHTVAQALALEFVPYTLVPATLPVLDALRDTPSRLTHLVGQNAWSEGIVIRPRLESVDARGNRVIAKHKRPAMRETTTPRNVGDPAIRLAAEAAAKEWVTEERMNHVLDHLAATAVPATSIEHTGMVIKAMLEDVLREGAGEVVDDRPTRKAISTAAAVMYKQRITQVKHGLV